MVFILVIVIFLIGLARAASSEPRADRVDSYQRAEDRDDEMLEDWHTSQELDNDLDDWDR